MINKEEIYKEFLQIANSVIEEDAKIISNMANACALIKDKFDHHWVGFYLVDETLNQLYLGPFQGPLACNYIPYGKGVCGQAWAEGKTFVVGNVHEFAGHIACSSLSNSEIVVPIRKENKVIAVLDIDSIHYNQFDDIDHEYLEKFCRLF